MSKQWEMTLDGGAELLHMLQASGRSAGKVLGQALEEEANEIFGLSQVLVPIDTGALRGSGGVSAPEFHGDNDVSVDIFYGGTAAPYALLVHEIMGYHHNAPTQAKYLEEPFMDRLENIKQNLASRILDMISKEAR